MTRRAPATIAILVILCAAAVLQFRVGGWLEALQRDPVALAAGEWWRPLSALFAYDGGLPQVATVMIGVAAAGIVAEQRFGWVAWFALFWISAIVGQIIGLRWQPMGAGPSVGLAGQVGALAVSMLRSSSEMPISTRLGPALVLAGGLYFTWNQDIHGPPVLLGAAIGFLLLRLRHAAPSP